MKWQKLKIWVKTWLKRILNWRFLVCFLIAWMITNGWSYISFAISSIFDISWLKVVATTYISLLWLPFTPEKILTYHCSFHYEENISSRSKINSRT